MSGSMAAESAAPTRKTLGAAGPVGRQGGRARRVATGAVALLMFLIGCAAPSAEQAFPPAVLVTAAPAGPAFPDPLRIPYGCGSAGPVPSDPDEEG